MRVFQIGSSLYDWGGIERYVAYLSQGLRGRGHEVAVVCPPGSPLEMECGVRTIPIALRKQFGFWLYPRFLRLFRESRWDVVHIHFSPDFVIPAMAAKKAGQPLLAMTRHVALPWSPPKVKRYLSLFDHIIPVSEAVRGKLHESGVPDGKMTVAKAGAPALVPTNQPEEVRRELGIPEGAFAVGFFGRLVEDKGVQVLIEAMRRARSEVVAEVFGDGPYRPKLEAMARELAHRVRFRGFSTDVPNLMGAMDAVAIPSVWDEPFPYSALEAMSLGKPIVASDTGGLPELVEDGKTGLLFPKADSESLANRLNRLSGDRECAKAFGLNALQVHRANFTVEKMAERIEAVYAQCGAPLGTFRSETGVMK